MPALHPWLRTKYLDTPWDSPVVSVIPTVRHCALTSPTTIFTFTTNNVFFLWKHLKTELPSGQAYDFEQLKGKVVLIVNVASKCGFIPQYKAFFQRANSHRVGAPRSERIKSTQTLLRRRTDGIGSALDLFCPILRPDIIGHVLKRLFEQFPPTTLFPNLCELHFEAVFGLLEHSSKFWLLRQFISPRLQALRFDVTGIPMHKWRNYLLLFPQKRTPGRSHRVRGIPGDVVPIFEHLERIYVIDKSEHPDYLLVIPLHSESFRPSFKFKGLSSVKFIGIGNFELDDSFLNDVPVAWPGIQELKFISWKRRASYSVTFTAMISLASRCRSLQTLHLTVDATQSTTIPRAPGGTEKLWPTQTTLRNLHLGYSRVSEVAHIPYFLADVFPTLWDFKFYERYVRNCAADIDLRLALEEAYSQLMTLRNSPYDNSDKLWETDSDDSGT
ncbi:uncharacterized protein F5891DRAFT_1176600 [Suillus fuscotomentosus]|uniref:Glutathione peroxidase n=1 Tax=Suillus fuscotomentosus TaxID=1912939 RepID=A0AAD4DSF9_9AGAM|nr:uncharacterized protein F5891DRAFT_1176600 [Suillus fuscotomentosus]KAG1892981.1 hypothetical protein F5891DRAFT_1176600 [Suillus fuscotomentosus]